MAQCIPLRRVASYVLMFDRKAGLVVIFVWSAGSSNTVLAEVAACVFFFFSSRRRHTRFDCDWSSDVCSSDLRHRRQRDAFLRRLGGEILAGIDEAIALEIVLFIVELFVPAVGDEQLLMRAVFDNLAAFEYQNLIGAPNRRQTVRDHERRPAAPQGP